VSSKIRDLKMKPESPIEALEHVRFQLDLLKLTSMPVKLTGPSVMREVEPQPEAVGVMNELESTILKMHKP